MELEGREKGLVHNWPMHQFRRVCAQRSLKLQLKRCSYERFQRLVAE
jgi:hypothetical protein